MRHLLARLTLARVVVVLVVMTLIILVDNQLYLTPHYYNPSAVTRFVLATLITACAVMLYEKKPN